MGKTSEKNGWGTTHRLGGGKQVSASYFVKFFINVAKTAIANVTILSIDCGDWGALIWYIFIYGP